MYYIIKGPLRNETSVLYQILLNLPIPKPHKTQFGDKAALLVLFLGEEMRDNILQELVLSEANAFSPDGDTTPRASHIGYLPNRWGELMEPGGDLMISEA